ncbi:uncharacterized [Tachysurus ichikawai]
MKTKKTYHLRMCMIDVSDVGRQLYRWKLSPRARMENMDDKHREACSDTTTSDPHRSSHEKARVRIQTAGQMWDVTRD